MTFLLVFAVTLLVAVLISGILERTVLSTATLFLVVGFLAVYIDPENPAVKLLIEIAVFAVLFTDGTNLSVRDLISAWRLPGRALLLGFPLTLLATSALAHFVAGLPWTESLLIGAILAPTDPVFASALIGREEVPLRLRRLLNVESGVNDGLALPFVVVLLAISSPGTPPDLVLVLEEIALGIVIGVVVPYIAVRLERARFIDLARSYEPLYVFAVGVLVFALAYVTHANLFLAAFFAGVTTVSAGPQYRDVFYEFGELLTELIKLAAILIFGALMSFTLLGEIGWGGYTFALLALLVVRPLALGVALVRSRLSLRERVVVAWFGPKGFASLVFALLVLESGIDFSEEVFNLVALVVAASILLHTSTDVLVARQFEEDHLETEAQRQNPNRS